METSTVKRSIIFAICCLLITPTASARQSTKARLYAERYAAAPAQRIVVADRVSAKRCWPSCEALLSLAARSAGVNLLIELEVPELPPEPQSPIQSSEQRIKIQEQRRAIIAKAKERLVARLSGKYRLRPGLDYSTAVAIHVDEIALRALLANPDVKHLSEERRYKTSLRQTTTIVGADQAWSGGLAGAGYTVAILDTGIDRAHPFLAGKVIQEACFSSAGTGVAGDGTPYTITSLCPSGANSEVGTNSARPCTGVAGCEHGTHVAGIAAGNDGTFSGIGRSANVIGIPVFGRIDAPAGCDPNAAPCLSADRADLVAALDWLYMQRLDPGFNVAAVNMSLGFVNVTPHCDDDEPQLKARIDQLNRAGIAIVAASGNEGMTNALSSPACISSVISVGATTKNDTVPNYSNSASILSLLAPGGEIANGIISNSCSEGLAGVCSSVPTATSSISSAHLWPHRTWPVLWPFSNNDPRARDRRSCLAFCNRAAWMCWTGAAITLPSAGCDCRIIYRGPLDTPRPRSRRAVCRRR